MRSLRPKMANYIRRQVAVQLAEAARHINGSASQDTEQIAWCVRCAASKKSETLRHSVVVPYKHLRSCKVIPPEYTWQQQVEWANKVLPKISATEEIVTAEAKNDYFVIDINPRVFSKNILHEIAAQREDYGKTSLMYHYRENADGTLEKTSSQQTVVVEYSSPNIAKPFHVGHLRSTIIGNFIANINESLSNRVIRLNYLGDWGTQFGILGVGYQKYGSNSEMSSNAMQHLFDVYVKINSSLKDPGGEELHKQGKAFFKRMEDGDVSAKALWQYCRDSSIREYSRVYERLGVHFDYYEGESQYQEQCRHLMDELRRREVLRLRGDPPAAYVDISDSEGHRQEVTVQKSDGTTLYVTRDIAAAIDRYDRFRFDRAHYVVENGQHLHFQHMLGVLRRLDYEWADRCADTWHVKFGRVDGMSTRRGKVVFLKDVLDEAQARMLEAMRSTETTKVTDNVEQVADRLGVSAVIIGDLKERRMRNYQFSWEQALRFSGDTGVSLQYAHARLCSLERNCGVALNFQADVDHLTEPSATDLIQHLARFDQCIHESFLSLEPSMLTAYLFTLRHLINAANKNLQVKGQPKEIAEARLLLFYCARQTLSNGLRLLGVTPLERM